MTFSYTSRSGTKYFLKKGLTKTGKPRYAFVRELKPGDEAASGVPAGYEISESPNGLVSLVKIAPKLIPAADLALINKALKSKEVQRGCEAVIKKNTVVIYDSDQPDLSDMTSPFIGFSLGVTFKSIKRPIMKLEFDQESQEYGLFRWCFSGSIDDWIFLSSVELKDLVKYFRHIGKDSFYDLM